MSVAGPCVPAHPVAPESHRPAPPDNRFARLTKRQRDCLRLVAQGYTSKEIGRELGISYSTVDNHLLAAAQVLEVPGRAQAARALMEHEKRPRQELPRQPEPLAAAVPQTNDVPRIAGSKTVTRLGAALPPIGGKRNELSQSQRIYAIARISLFSTLVFVACVIVIRTCFDALR